MKITRSALEEEAGELIANWFKDAGYSECASRVLAVALVEPNEISMENLAKKTGYSLASVSTVLNSKLVFLERLGFYKKYSKPGSKRVFVYADMDLARIQKEALAYKLKNQIRPALKRVPQIIKKYSRLKDVKSMRELEKLRKMESDLKKMEKMFELVAGD